MTFSIVSSDKGVLQHAPEIHSGALMAMDVEGMLLFFKEYIHISLGGQSWQYFFILQWMECQECQI